MLLYSSPLQPGGDNGNSPIYSRQGKQKTLGLDSFARKAHKKGDSFLEGHKGTQIVNETAPLEGDPVVDKSYSSAFYGTRMVSYLNGLGVDTILMTGGTTSDCVHATTGDAISRDYNVAVVEEGVSGRIEISHTVSLFEMWMNYCDVISVGRHRSIWSTCDFSEHSYT